MIRRSRVLRAAFAVAAIAVVAALLPGTATAATSWYAIGGSGSTWSENAIKQWSENAKNNYGMTVNFSGQGSTAGRTDFIAGTVDFAVSEIPFQTTPQDGSLPERPSRGYAYMPIVAGGTSFMYNLKIGGKKVTNLRLSGQVITRIFTGEIRKWNDPAIQADNPGLAMPDKNITPVVRSDGSGTSAQFTLWMSKQFGNIWPHGMTSQFPPPPNGKAQAQSIGVAGYVSQDYGEGSITYVEYSYAINAGFPVAKVLNSAGYYIEPTANSVAVALLGAQINNDANSPDYLTQNLDNVYNNADARTYPLSSYSYMIIPTKVEGIFNNDKGRTLGAFTRYVLCDGQQYASRLGYSPLPLNLVLAGSEQIKRIPGAGGTGIDINNCKNPTFAPGDSPGSNRLAASAPQPADCDKQGPNQCTTGTAGATDETPTTGGGTGGGSTDGAGGSAAGGGGAAGDPAAAGGATAEAVYDETGALISGGGALAGGAVSSPFTLAGDGMGAPQWMMLAAGVLLLAVIIAPVFVARSRGGTRSSPPKL
jgi:phosphate transport system substrate-binding protein